MKHASFIPLSYLFRVFALVVAVQVSFLTKAQEPATYSILVAGHAYGAHAGTNLGLHQPLIDKLRENKDTAVEGLFLTGDIVNTSTTASWAQVEKELTELGLKSYYIMGNHDNNTIGRAIFTAKHGGLYYSFQLHSDLYVVLNSTESDRSISSTQLSFLAEVLQKATGDNKRVFIFFHEVIWNSHEKYRLVRSNSRSRYDQIKSASNFWQKVVPILDTYPEINFYLFSGDVGGNPDAIAAFYDRWGHMTLLSSGIGEVPDENYMKVNITPDTVSFTLIPLNSRIQMNPVTYYSVPDAPQQITGPSVVNPSEGVIRYEVSSVWNATSYKWTFTPGITGISETTFADLTFGGQYQTGQLSVRAVKDGFGESDPVTLKVNASGYTSIDDSEINSTLNMLQNDEFILLNYSSENSINARIRIFHLTGKLLYDQQVDITHGLNTIRINKNQLGKGVVMMNCLLGNHYLNKKIMIY